jgi:hypothetical protein
MGMRLLVLTVACGLGACTMRNFNRATLVASHVTIACDYGQTLAVARGGWSDPNMSEWNPVLGDTPSPMRLTAYNAVAIGVVTGAYLALPEKWRWLPAVVTVLVQLQTISANAIVAPRPWCGL